MSVSATAPDSPFQATKLWNQMIRNFREGIELKKRRWKMKMYEKSFCGSDAVDWFLLYLRSNQKFGNHVTRAQSKQLLQKFIENNICEDARGKGSKTFEDDNHLYKFTEKADELCRSKAEFSTQRSVTNLIRSVSIRRINLNDIAESTGAMAPPKRQNFYRVTRSQSMKQALTSPRNAKLRPESVSITPLAEHLSEFNIDSAKKITDGKNVHVEGKYSQNVFMNGEEEKENNPSAEESALDVSNEDHYCSILQGAGIDNRAFIVAEMSPLVSTFSRTRSLRDPRAMRYRHTFVVNCDEEESIHEPNLNFHKSFRRSALKRPKANKSVVGLKFKKTDQCESPTKKPKTEHETSVASNNERDADANQLAITVQKPSTSAASTAAAFAAKRHLHSSGKSDSSLAQLRREASQKFREANQASELEETENTLKANTFICLKDVMEVENLDDFINLSLIRGKDIKMNIDTELKSTEIPEWVLSAMKFLVIFPERESSKSDTNLPSYKGFEVDVFRAIQDHYECSLKEPLMTFNLFKLVEQASEFITKKHERAVLIFQYLCLIIPQWNRKQIYLLLRFMDRLSKNVELKLSQELLNKEMVVKTFHSILTRNKDMNCPEKDNMTSIRAVTFMIENHEQILRVPQELKNKLEQRESQKELNQITATLDSQSKVSNRPVSYCVQIAKQEYAKQAEDCTRKALVDLLNMIANDDTLPPRIKKKRLKEFKKNYPEIYQRKFPEDNISTGSTSSQRTLRIRQTIRPFFFNKNNSVARNWAK